MNAPNNETPGKVRKTTNPGLMVTTFVLLCFLFSAPFWYLIAQLPSTGKGSQVMRLSVAGMWCPAAAALLTRLWHQRSLKGFGLGAGKARWLFLGMLLPAVAGLLVFAPAWIFGIAPIEGPKVAKIFSFSFIPFFLVGLGFDCFAAFGEELGWRGLLVPELSRCMGFTGLSLLSGAIWTVWHFPLIIFGSYHGEGSIWVSLAAFIPLVMASGLIQAWLRLASGSIWGSVLMHGSSNYFIQVFYPYMTRTTPAGERMLGEFGWCAPVVCVGLAVGFWYFRNRLPKAAVQRIG